MSVAKQLPHNRDMIFRLTEDRPEFLEKTEEVEVEENS